MADSSIFGNLLASASASGMGNPMTPQAGAYEPWEQDILNKMSPDVAGAFLLNRKSQDVYNNPNLFRELLNVATEERFKEATNAARIQAERDKRNFQYSLIASIPQTINQVSSDIARMTFNAPRLQILAGIPDQVRAAYGSMPAINIPRTRGFS